MLSNYKVISYTLIIAFIFLLSGCFTMMNRRYTSSAVDYLYPDKAIVEEPTIPQLSLPLSVGIAFVPESNKGPMISRLSRKDKMDLMGRISAKFKALQFVKDIELIPNDYLTSGGGFTNLDQIKLMYNIDVIALISYDQIQHTDEGILSFSYLTILGAYVIQGEKNDTNTMIDAVMYDIPSRKMLFRAPGTSHIKGSSTLVNLSEDLREDSLKGFNEAADNLVINLNDELDRFKEKIREMPEAYTIAQKPGYTGAGSVGSLYAVILLMLGGMGLWYGREK